MVKLKFKPGQVILTKYDNIFSNTIAMGLGNYFTHALWIREVSEDNLVIQQASGSKSKQVKTKIISREHFENLFFENRTKLLDFKILPTDRFHKYCKSMEGIPYDYYSIFELFFIRVLTLFGLDTDKLLRTRFFKWITFLYSKDYSTPKKVDCSELISRGINELTNFDVLNTLKVSKYDLVTPQMIDILHYKLKQTNRL